MIPEKEREYITLHRQIREWEWYQDSHMVHLFIHLLLSANYEDGAWQGIPLKRGQLITGRKSLSNATGISERSIRTCLSKLEMTGEVTIKPTKRFSIITICKYNDYQIEKEETDQQNDQQTDQVPTKYRPSTDHKEEVNNINNINNKHVLKDKKLKDKTKSNNIQSPKVYRDESQETEKKKRRKPPIPKIVSDLVDQYMDFEYYPDMKSWAGKEIRNRARRNLNKIFDNVEDWSTLIKRAHTQMKKSIESGEMEYPYMVTNFFGRNAKYEMFLNSSNPFKEIDPTTCIYIPNNLYLNMTEMYDGLKFQGITQSQIKQRLEDLAKRFRKFWSGEARYHEDLDFLQKAYKDGRWEKLKNGWKSYEVDINVEELP